MSIIQKNLNIILFFLFFLFFASLFLCSLCSGFVSTNVPLDHFSYDAIDKLIGQGLIDSAMVTTRPVSRLEMARHIAEVIEKA